MQEKKEPSPKPRPRKKTQKKQTRKRVLSKKTLVGVIAVVAIVLLSLSGPYIGKLTDPPTTYYVQTTVTHSVAATTYTCTEVEVIGTNNQTTIHFVTQENSSEYETYVSGTLSSTSARIVQIESTVVNPC